MNTTHTHSGVGLPVDVYLCSPWSEYAGRPDRAWLVLAGRARPPHADGAYLGRFMLIAFSGEERRMLQERSGVTMPLVAEFPGARCFEVVAQTIDGRVGVLRGEAGLRMRVKRARYLRAAARARWDEYTEARHGAETLAMVRHAERHSFRGQVSARHDAILGDGRR